MHFTVKLDSLQFCIEAIRPPFILSTLFDSTVCSFDELRVRNEFFRLSNFLMQMGLHIKIQSLCFQPGVTRNLN